MADADATAPGGGSGGGQSQEPRLAPPTDDDEEEQPKSYPPDGTILPAYTGAAPPKPHAGDADPLLVSRIPPFPTDDELRALLTAAPLSYTEARAVLGDTGEEDEAARYPARRFCGVCGYWGRVRCTKCGARVCALDCLDVHRQECFTRYGM
jgi:zinc finger HIT domain-containing protein 1